MILPRVRRQLAWKIFVLDNEGEFRFLYHGLNSSRKVPVDKWLVAKQRQVRDGSGQKMYLSGFHAYISFAAARIWLSRTTKVERRTIVPVLVFDWHPKPNATIEGCILARCLLVPWEPEHYIIVATD